MLATPNPPVTLTADQLYQIGFGDGLAGRRQDRRFAESLDYATGHVAGDRTRPDSLFNVPKATEGYDEIGWGDALLNPLD